MANRSLGHRDPAVTEQYRNALDWHTGLKQSDREGVPDSVCVAVGAILKLVLS